MRSPSLSFTSILQGVIGSSTFCALIVAKVMISSPVSIGATLDGWAADLCFKQFFDAGESLNVIGVGVRGDHHLTAR